MVISLVKSLFLVVASVFRISTVSFSKIFKQAGDSPLVGCNLVYTLATVGLSAKVNPAGVKHRLPFSFNLETSLWYLGNLASNWLKKKKKRFR